MSRPPKSSIRIQFGLSGWVAIISALAIFSVLVAAIAFLAVGLFVILLPILLIAPVLYYFMPNLRPKVVPLNGGETQWETKGHTVIDGDFRVVDACEVEGNAKPPGESGP